MRTLILTDNPFACALATELERIYGDIEVFQSPNGALPGIPRMNVRRQISDIVERYDLVISIHCKQLFPSALVNKVRCVNVHPGFNPYNRGYFPQVFSIINGLKVGVTIHEVDDQLDHGPIIAQRECKIESWDTSGTVYSRLMSMERELVLQHFSAIREGNYRVVIPAIEGNINYRKDFDRLRALDLDEVGKFGDFLNRLRALTHDDFRNAYFVDKSGRNVFVRVILEPDDS